MTTHTYDEHIAKDGFRLRGTAMSRIDGFSDVVFGFALTLLIVSLEVPKTYAELHHTFREFLPFAVSFTFLIALWFAHFRLFRRFGLHDNATIIVNSILLFVVLFFVYPLKFLFSMLLGGGDASKIFSSMSEVRELMVLYGLGFAAVYFLLATLYWFGWRHRDELELNSLERKLTWVWITDHLGVGAAGVISALLSLLLSDRHVGYAGFAFYLIIPFKIIHGTITRRTLKKARAELHLLQSLAHIHPPA